ncbi:hypothetical protein SAMN04487896_1375 [Paenibacillus sp. ov031]|nr:hypothetical protein SAMN05428961_10264 [Paenibacillus sp. OK060]SHN59466.1 hypothetical protein SAMN04487896_1375 [Paenibacillus sp. ov031]
MEVFFNENLRVSYPVELKMKAIEMNWQTEMLRDKNIVPYKVAIIAAFLF